MSNDSFIRMTLRLAQKAIGRTSTNPLVGAILTIGKGTDQRVIAQGYHRRYGGPHAEVEAIRAAKKRGYDDLSEATLYVNLEPCCHIGKTPACTDLIIRERIAHVICGLQDPFPAVSGKGLKKLREAGIRVDCGFLEKEGRRVNRNFFKHIETGLPRITMKVAQTLDGNIATLKGDSKWITGEPSRKKVHRMRTHYDAVCVGAGTVIADNPSLTVRLVRGRQPWRVIVDGKLRSPLRSAVFSDSYRDQTIVLTNRKSSDPRVVRLRHQGVTVYSFPGKTVRLASALRKLVKVHHIASVLVEGGGRLHGEFLRARLVDDVAIFVSPMILGTGRPSVDAHLSKLVRHGLRVHDPRIRRIGQDILVTGNL